MVVVGCITVDTPPPGAIFICELTAGLTFTASDPHARQVAAFYQALAQGDVDAALAGSTWKEYRARRWRAMGLKDCEDEIGE